jgi:hypothetical protein
MRHGWLWYLNTPYDQSGSSRIFCGDLSLRSMPRRSVCGNTICARTRSRGTCRCTASTRPDFERCRCRRRSGRMPSIPMIANVPSRNSGRGGQARAVQFGVSHRWPNGEIRYIRSRAHFYVSEEGAPSFIGAEWDVTADVLINEEAARQKMVAEARARELEESTAVSSMRPSTTTSPACRTGGFFDKRIAQLAEDDSVSTLAVHASRSR